MARTREPWQSSGLRSGEGVSAKLVAVKSKAQRRVESAVLLILMPASAYAVWRAAGPTLMTLLLVVLEFYLVPTAGSVLAASLTKERITIEEAQRRITMRMFEKPVALRFLLVFVAYLDFGLSATLPLFPRERLGEYAPTMVAIAAGGALILTLVVVLHHRRRYRNYVEAVKPGAVARQPYAPREWLQKTMPGYYAVWFATLLGAQMVAAKSGDELTRTLILLGAMWAAILLEALLSGLSKDTRPPTLWTQFGFGMALLAAVLHMGLPLALLGWLLGAPHSPLFQAITAAIGFAFGTLIMLWGWALTRLYVFDPRRRPG